MQTIHNTKTKEDFRKELRKHQTPQELILWSFIRRKQLGFKFTRQHSIGKYIVDFYCAEKKLILEIDGWQHRKENNEGYDLKRTLCLEKLEFKVLRFWNNEINKNIEGVIFKIQKYL